VNSKRPLNPIDDLRLVMMWEAPRMGSISHATLMSAIVKLTEERRAHDRARAALRGLLDALGETDSAYWPELKEPMDEAEATLAAHR